MVRRVTLGFQYPSQSVQEPLSGSLRAFRRSPPRFGGDIVIAETDDAGYARDVELFLARAGVAAADFELDIRRAPRGSLLAGTALTVSASAIASGILTLSFAGAADGLVAGDYVTAGGRLYILTSDMASGSAGALPAVEPAAGAAVEWEAPFAVARLHPQETEQFQSAVDASGIDGPWIWTWQEEI